MKRATRRHLTVAKENATGRKRFRATLAGFLRSIRANHGHATARGVHRRLYRATA